MTTPNEPESHGRTPSARSKVTAGQVAALVVLTVLVVVILENTRRVTVRLIVPEVHTSLAVALLIAGVLGALVLLLVQRRRGHR